MKLIRIHSLFGGVWASLFFAGVAQASQTTGLPYENALETIVESVTGPVAGTLGFLTIVLSGGALIIRGGEISDFGRLLLQIGVGIGIVVGSAPVMSTLFGFGGAELTAEYFAELVAAANK